MRLNKENCWSPYPREACSIVLESGERVGIGMHPIFELVPGAWNLLWLTFAPLDGLAYYNGSIEKFPLNCDALAVCVGAALQGVKSSDLDVNTIGDLALKVRPKEFIQSIKSSSSFIPFAFYGESWLKVANHRAEGYKRYPNNVIQGRFGRKK